MLPTKSAQAGAPRRILLCPGGTRGDVQPVVALALRLQAAGHKVLIAAAPNFADWTKRQGIPFHPVGHDVQEFMVAHSKGSDGRPVTTTRMLALVMRRSVSEQFPGLMELGGDFDLMVGASIQMAGPSVAEHFGIPYRWAFFCPQSFPSDRHPPFIFPHQTMPRFLNRMLWTLQTHLGNWRMLGDVNRQRARIGLGPVHDMRSHLMGHRPFLASSPELAETPPEVAAQVVQTGFWHHEEPGARLPEPVDRFLGGGPKPVYIGFGSMGDPNPARSTATLREALRRTGLRAIVYRGWAGLGENLQEENLLVTGDTPHPLLFPRCAAVVHHGGAGTTHTAARAGVPQVIVPHLLDQFYWGHHLWQRGLAPKPLRKSRLSAGNFAAALLRATQDPSMAERAAETGTRLRQVDGVALAMQVLLSG